VYVEDGPTLTTSGELDPAKSDAVHAVDTLNVTVADGGNSTVAVQPGDLSKIEFVYIASDQYGDGTDLTYKFSDDTGDTGSIALDRPHIVTSGSLVGLYGKAPKQIKIANGTGSDASIDIVIARKAI
jgi:hypothetical protein